MISIFKYNNLLVKGFYKTVIDTNHSVRGSDMARARLSNKNKFKTIKLENNIDIKELESFLIKLFTKIK